MSRPPIEAVVVVVPVHDEAALLEGCLVALRAAVAALALPCEVKVVLDACSDASGDVAARHPFPVVHSAARAVGAARALGIAAGLRAVRHVASARVWIANTDADSQVPAEWLTSQIALADGGADVVVGTVRPDFEDLSPAHRERWLATHEPGAPNGHTHGANLGVRASTYLAAGGFRAASEHEDVLLVDECRRFGASIAASDAGEVLTSGRFIGRTPGGYAGYMREQARMLRVAQDAPLAEVAR